MGTDTKKSTAARKPAQKPARKSVQKPPQKPAPGAKKAPATRAGAPKRAAKPAASGSAHPLSRIIGAALLILAAYLAALMFAPDLGWRQPLRVVVNAVGVAAVPVVVGAVLFALLLALRPDRLSSPAARRSLIGAALVALLLLALLGAFGAGGATGNALWRGLDSQLGLGAVVVLLVAGLLALLLLGAPPRALWRGVTATARGCLRAGSAVLYWCAGFVVWSARKVTDRRASRESDEQIEPGPETEPEAEPVWALPEPALTKPEPFIVRPTDEVTEPLQPVIRATVEEAVGARSFGDWTLPPITLLAASPQVEVSEVDARKRAKTIEDTLHSFGVEVRVREINPGPTVTQFALEPGLGTKVSRITSLQNDLALALAAPSIRMEAPVPGQSRVGLEIPNTHAATVRLRDVMDSATFHNSKGKLKLALGRDVTGKSIVGDLARMPHLLIAGATGAGKSVCLNSIIAGFLFQHTPDDLRFLMVDPKMVELKTFDGVPHLVWPVVTEVEKVVGVLKYAVAEMERRYKEFSKLGIRNLDGYNRKVAAEGVDPLPRMVVIIDELADLMMAAPEEVEASICRLAQMARAVGIHLILATQRPSVDVLTGLIKANFPSRIAFAVSSGIDSRVILDTPGAERLLGRGDMLFIGPDSAKPLRVQGTYVADDEIDGVVEHWKRLRPADYDPQVGRMLEAESQKSQNPHEDPLYGEALQLAATHARLSTSLLQRKLRIGYNRAARLMDALRDSGELDTELDD